MNFKKIVSGILSTFVLAGVLFGGQNSIICRSEPISDEKCEIDEFIEETEISIHYIGATINYLAIELPVIPINPKTTAATTAVTTISTTILTTIQETIPTESLPVAEKYGDVNLDGFVTVGDLVLLQKWLISVPNTTLPNWKVADLCEDDILNVFDLCLMKRILLE